LSLIFPPTVYHGQVLLPLLLGNEQLIWSVAHVKARWSMAKRAWVHEFAWLITAATRCDYSGNKIVTPCTCFSIVASNFCAPPTCPLKQMRLGLLVFTCHLTRAMFVPQILTCSLTLATFVAVDLACLCTPSHVFARSLELSVREWHLSVSSWPDRAP